jgi:hypothetical protein
VATVAASGAAAPSVAVSVLSGLAVTAPVDGLQVDLDVERHMSDPSC